MGKEVSLGPTGENVRANVKRIRQARGLSYAELSRELEETGRPIPPLGLRRLEAGERRVDTDELTALAWVLWVDPVALLLPPLIGPRVELTGPGQVPGPTAIAWVSGSPDQLSQFGTARGNSVVANSEEARERMLFWKLIRPRLALEDDRDASAKPSEGD